MGYRGLRESGFDCKILTENEASWVLRAAHLSFSSSSITWFMALFSQTSTATPTSLRRFRRASAFSFTVYRKSGLIIYQLTILLYNSCTNRNKHTLHLWFPNAFSCFVHFQFQLIVILVLLMWLFILQKSLKNKIPISYCAL